MPLLLKHKWSLFLAAPALLYAATFPFFYSDPDASMYFKVYSLFHSNYEHQVIDANKEVLVNNNEGFELGDYAPDFSLSSIEGSNVTLAEQKGKYVLLSFWASWCPICRGENNNLRDVYSEYSDQGFEIVGVSLDRVKVNWEKAVEVDNINWIQVSDLQGVDSEIATKYGVYVTPTTFLIDPDGKILAKNLKGEELNNVLEELF